MKRSGLKRKTPLKRPAPPLDVAKAGGKARGRQKQVEAGIPDGTPRNKFGQSCAEVECVICGEVFLAQWSDRLTRKTCSRPCMAESNRRKAARSRLGAENPGYRHGRRAGVRDRGGERRFEDTHPTCRHPACPGVHGLAQHHVVYRQEVRRAKGDVWDPDNALRLCMSCHSSHHQRGARVVPLSALRDENFAYAERLLGAGAAYEYLRRRYAGEDPRLADLLERSDDA